MSQVWRLYRPERRAETRTDFVVLLAGYFLVMFAGVFGARTPGDHTVFWAANGVLVAGLLVLRPRWRLVFMAVCCAANLGMNAWQGLTPALNLTYVIPNIAAAVLVAFGARRFCGAALDLSRPKRLAQFTVVSAISMTAVVLIGGWTLNTFFHPWDAPVDGPIWFIGDFLGLMLSAPAMLMLMQRRRLKAAAGLQERSGILALIVGATALGCVRADVPLLYLVYPVLLLAAFRLGAAWIYLAVYLSASVATFMTVHGYGPLSAIDPVIQDTDLRPIQLFAASLLLAAVPAASALAERERNARRLARREAAARDAHRRAEAAIASKAGFLAMMSHEIRTPLNAVIGFSQILNEQQDLTEETRRKVGLIGRSSRVLKDLVNDLLDFSKMDAGKFDLSPVADRLQMTLEDAVAIVRDGAEDKGLVVRLESDVAPDAGHVFDGARLRQVLLNLLSNAIKFTARGEVVLSCEVTAGEAADVVEIAVHDTGTGIPEDKLPLLFQAFTQVDASIGRQHGGTGLGLAISQSLVQLMGGKITVESSPAGSTFRFTLQLERAEAVEDDADRIDVERDAWRVLVVDDHPVNREIACLMLRTAGHEPEAVEDGPSAIEAVQTGDYDIVLLDIRMPGMDGFQVARAIRALPDRRALTPILAVSADTVADQMANYVAAGMNGHVSKPINRMSLLEAIDATLDARPEPDFDADEALRA
ncbi:MAG: ATP-binding protein [Brevundimonas sp.]|uniref:ATP-binding protein n=1 Tax=Brevundimonas sp. TaxID=1871086 RepID=UPI004033C22F